MLPLGRQRPTLKARHACRHADAAASSSEARRLLGLQQYDELKAELLKNTALFGAGLGGYLAVAQHDPVSGASVLVGATGAVAYLALLCRHVDGLGKRGKVRGMKLQRNPGENIGAVLLGAVQRVGDVYWCVLLLARWHAAAACAPRAVLALSAQLRGGS